MPAIPFTRRRNRKPVFPPPGDFVLITPEDVPNLDVTDENLDGPYSGAEGDYHVEEDGLLVFRTEGLPGLLRVEDVGDGRVVTFIGGVKARVEPWPLDDGVE